MFKLTVILLGRAILRRNLIGAIKMDKMIRATSYGEVGIDTEASPGNGEFYVKLYDGSYDVVGFDTVEEAWAELEYVACGIVDVEFEE
jgi:hypothetical protein